MPADYDGDHQTDVAIWRNDATWHIRESTTGNGRFQQLGDRSQGDKPVPADYDGDGSADLAVWRPSTGQWFIIDSSTNDFRTIGWGDRREGDVPVPGDYDGDEQADLAIWRPTEGSWHIRQSTTGTIRYVVWGEQNLGDMPVQSDYDGDGKTDVAVWRASTGQWFIRHSGDGSTRVQGWGDRSLGDVPVPGHYDDDGKADLAVWRASDGWWHVYQSASSTGLYRQWGLQSQGDVPVPATYIYANPGTGSSSGSSFATARLNPRNRTGQPGEDLLSGNYHWSLPLISLPGRAGLDLGLALSYNSLVWTRDDAGARVAFDADNGFPTAGFRFGFPVVQPRFYDGRSGKNAFLLITAAGRRVELRQAAAPPNTYDSVDSSYLRMEDYGGMLQLWTPDGTRMSFVYIGDEYQCTEVKDRNGNFITIGYTGFGRVRTITDTLGRVLTIEYDANDNPTEITQQQTRNGQQVTHRWVTFAYGAPQVMETNFGGLGIIGPLNGTPVTVLRSVGLDDNSSYHFDYTSWGQVRRITRTAAGLYLAHTTYNLADGAGAAHSDCPRFTERREWARHWNNDVEGNPAEIEEAQTTYAITPGVTGEVVLADRTTAYREYYWATDNWARGLLDRTETYDNGVPKKSTKTDWGQDGGATLYQTNPRPVAVHVEDPSGNKRKTTVSYGPYEQYGLPHIVEERAGENGHQLLRKTQTDYVMHPDYLNRRIIGLVLARHMWDGAGVLHEKTTYGYDWAGHLAATATEPVAHDPAYNINHRVGRGNLTAVGQWDARDPGNPAGSHQREWGFDTAGSVLWAKDAAGHRTTLTYDDNFSDDLNRHTYAYPVVATDPDNHTTITEYLYDTGLVNAARDQKGVVTVTSYDAARRVTRVTNTASGGHTRWEYPANLAHVERFTTLQDGHGEDYWVEFYDGAGRVRAAGGYLDGSVGGWRGQYVGYDRLGRESGRTNLTEMDGGWTPAGDDAAAGWVSSGQWYDWQGRPTVTTNQDGTTREAVYDGCGCAGGEVVTLKGELLAQGRRQRRLTSDALGRVRKEEVLNWDGSVYRTTEYTYNGRDQVERVVEREGTGGASQETTMEYDGHGRLWRRKAPEAVAPTEYAYYVDDTVREVKDARSATTTFTYNGRHLVRGITYGAPGGVAATPNVTMDYDAAGNREWMDDGPGYVDYVYNTLSQLESETRYFDDLPGRSYQIGYEYNVGGQLKSITVPFSAQLDYARNRMGRVTAVGGGGTQYATGMQYRAWGAMKGTNYGNGINLGLDYGVSIESCGNKMRLSK